jgi:hypothetical protein
VSEYLQTIEAKTLDKARCEVTNSIRQTDIVRLSKLANAAGKGWRDSPDPYSFIRNVTLSAPKEWVRKHRCESNTFVSTELEGPHHHAYDL